ncbi:MAG TPA: protein kinase [Gemmatimonadales bacterium]|nr:protein kinase [Gemmatimonadales bacterium]
MSEIDDLRAGLGDRYAVEREIGRGGMATVYQARDLKHERTVALKVLRPELMEVGASPERFTREIRFVAGLTHPHILPLHDSGELHGTPYYVMPLVTGESLRGRLGREGRLPVDEAVRIAAAVAAALDHAHRRGILHRDIKPENILLHEGEPVVTDFGIARAIDACCDDLTQLGLTVGTPAYMSPEQASGDAQLDGRSDVYGLGCVLYEMLTGQPPFASGSAMQVMARQVTLTPTPLRAVRAEVSPELEQVVARALAKEPDDRFPTAGEFGRALSRTLAAGTGTLSGVVPAAAAAAPAIAVLPLANQSPEPGNDYFADGLTDELIAALGQVEGLRVASRTSVFALRNDTRDVRALGGALGVPFVLEGAVRRAGDRLRLTVQLTDVADGHALWAERYDRAVTDVFAVQEEIARAIVAALRPRLLGRIGEVEARPSTRSVRAYQLYLRGRYYWNRRTGNDLVLAIECFQQALAEDPDYALAHAGLSDAYALQIDYQNVPVEQGMRLAREEAQRALALDESLPEAHTALAWVRFIHDWEWDDAEREFRRAIEFNPSYATAYSWYAWLLMARGRTDEALAASRTAVMLDPGSVALRRGMGWLLVYARRPEEAVEPLRRALVDNPTSAETHRILGMALMLAGGDADARAELEEAVEASERAPYDLALLGYLHAVRGRTAAARALLTELEHRARDRYVSPVAFATLHAGLGHRDDVFVWLERARQERRGWMVYLRVEPLLDGVRDDPRLDGLIRRMGL